MSDEGFAGAVEACAFPCELFHHREHLRLAWIYLRRYDHAEAEDRICETIRRFATHNGAPDKFDRDVTLAWMRRVREAIARCSPDASFEEVCRHDMMERLSHDPG